MFPPASPAVIATSRTARSCASPATRSVCNCHAAANFADARHRHHADVDPPPACVSCHMQARIYMVVDPRHDHSFRVPRPDTSAKLGTPNACNGCHRDRSASWAAAAVERWFGPARKGFQTYAAAFHAARNDAADAATLLAAVAADIQAPAIARASALSELAPRVSPANIEAAGARQLGRSRSGSADRRARHAGKPAHRPDLAVGFAAARRSRARRPRQGCLTGCGHFGRERAAGGSRPL